MCFIFIPKFQNNFSLRHRNVLSADALLHGLISKVVAEEKVEEEVSDIYIGVSEKLCYCFNCIYFNC